MQFKDPTFVLEFVTNLHILINFGCVSFLVVECTQVTFILDNLWQELFIDEPGHLFISRHQISKY